MVKILLCCGGGFSSSVLANAIKKGIIDNKLEKNFSIEFLPIDLGMQRMSDYNIMICCPHLLYNAKKIINNATASIPIYFLPPKMYGAVDFKELALDIEDILEIYKKTKTNPVHFPGEENTMTIPRFISYRNYNKLKQNSL